MRSISTKQYTKENWNTKLIKIKDKDENFTYLKKKKSLFCLILWANCNYVAL